MTFLRRFANNKKYQKTDHCLFSLKQGLTEPLRSYINRFNQVAQDVPIATLEILMRAFSHGLGDGEFFRDLIKNLSWNFDEMVEKVSCYIKVEEAQAARRKAERSPPSVNKQERRVPQPPPQPLPRAREARPTFQPGPEFARDSKRAAELGLPPPELAPQVLKMIEEQRAVVGQAGQPRPDLAGPRPTNGDSGRARKSHVRRLEVHTVGCNQEQATGHVISFGPADLEGLELPHDDALIIKAIIANSRVARVFIDTGSSVNIMFRTTFEEMQIDATELQPVATSLYGFTGNEVKPMGQIKLAISLSTEPLVRTRRSTFIVVDSPSSYNVILGRPALHEFRAAVSTFHQKIKFPVGEQDGEVKGEQKVSRRCYIDMVWVEARKNQRMQDGGIHSVQEEPLPMVEEPIPWEDVQLYAEHPKSLTRLASDLLLLPRKN
ncbi:uncharacterized protein LOC122019186 [Zingiber officinale]|uniref:uncharacterized protein LOC122019186 n=1 Tax=Zingiber officinale TaxID=94328 RepID=UPI001C4CAD2C|nr:uncharacterized protein LOC122019186 [Zingiber officinale]